MKNLRSILLTLVSLAFINVAHAQAVSASDQTSSDCVPQSEMQTIASHFHQFDALANAQLCNDSSQNWYLISSIMFMRKTVFSANMPVSKDELFSGRFASNWYDYFTGRIDTLEVVDSCPKGVIAYVYAFGGPLSLSLPSPTALM